MSLCTKNTVCKVCKSRYSKVRAQAVWTYNTYMTETVTMTHLPLIISFNILTTTHILHNQKKISLSLHDFKEFYCNGKQNGTTIPLLAHCIIYTLTFLASATHSRKMPAFTPQPQSITTRGVMEPAKIRIRRMRIAYEKSVGCGFVYRSKFVSTSYYKYCNST